MTPGGWYWGGGAHIWSLTPSNPAYSMVRVYRYAGTVVPAYCEDPPPTLVKSAASEVVAWLESVEGLETLIIGRSVGPHPAWQLDLAAVDPPSCHNSKEGLISLWSIAGQPIELPEAISAGDRLRAYLIETPSATVIMAANHHHEEGITTLTYDDFMLQADEVFGSLHID